MLNLNYLHFYWPICHNLRVIVVHHIYRGSCLLNTLGTHPEIELTAGDLHLPSVS